MDTKLYFTRRGLAKLKERIEELEQKLRDLQSPSAHVAAVGGDQWHDNASYDLLVIDLRGADRRLADAHACLRRAMPVDPPTTTDRVAIGTRVKIMRESKETTWEIVGFGESDPERGLLAYDTPLASVIIGKYEGDIVNGVIGGKDTEIEILEISKGDQGDVHNT